MKHRATLLVVGAAAGLIIGCDNPQQTEPNGAALGDLQKAACQGVIVLDEKIPLFVEETNPPALPQLAQISGQVNYLVEPAANLALDLVSISLAIDVTLQPLNATEPVWSFSGESQSFVGVRTQDPTIVLKQYKAIGRNQTVMLYVEFGVGYCSLSVEKMWAVNTPKLPGSPSEE